MVEQGYFDDESGMPRSAADEYKELGVDPRLDNRTGRSRPPVESDPAVPQQVDGPDLMHQEAHAEAVAKLNEASMGARKGMFSPGDHSLGDEEARKGNDAGQADERLETDPGSPDSAPTDARMGDVGAAGRRPADDGVRTSTAGASERASAAPGERRAVSTPAKSTGGKADGGKGGDK